MTKNENECVVCMTEKETGEEVISARFHYPEKTTMKKKIELLQIELAISRKKFEVYEEFIEFMFNNMDKFIDYQHNNLGMSGDLMRMLWGDKLEIKDEDLVGKKKIIPQYVEMNLLLQLVKRLREANDKLMEGVECQPCDFVSVSDD